MKSRAVITCLIIICALATPSLAFDYLSNNTHGKIIGEVIDAETGDLLPSVNITIEGTSLGASTNFRGEFYILGVPVGYYTLQASAIGFKTVKVRGVWVSAGLETFINIEMPDTPIELKQEIVVSAPSHDTGKRSTGTVHIISQEEIENLPAENLLDLMGILPGVVDNAFVRGGRQSEIDYQIDGVSISDPLFGSLPSGAFLNNLALREIQIFAGGFSANFGSSLSGIVNLVTREGGDIWSGDIRYKNSLSLLNGKNGSAKLNSRGEKILEFATGGPLKIGEKNLSLFFSGRADFQKNRTPGLGIRDPLGNNISDYQHNNLSETSLFAKASMDITPSIKAVFAGFFGNHNYEEDSWFWRYNEDTNALPVVTRKEDLVYFRLTHSFSKNLFLEAALEYNSHLFRRGVEKSSNSLFGYSILASSSGQSPVIYGAQNPYGVDGIFASKGVLDSYWSTRARYLSSKLSALWQITDNSLLKIGAEARKYSVTNYYQGNDFEEPTYQQDLYSHKPIDYSGYFSGTFNFNRFRFDTGFRLYYIDLKTTDIPHGEENIETAGSYANIKPKIRVSPRFGISAELSRKILAHSNFGIYHQPTTFHSIYAGTNEYNYNSEERIDGNPNLDFQYSSVVEAGLTFLLSDLISFDVTGYTKRLEDLEGIRMKEFGAFSLPEFSNKDHSRVTGLELSFTRHRHDRLAFKMSYTYSKAQGTLSFVEPVSSQKISNEVPVNQQNLDLSRSYAYSTRIEYYLPFDRTHNLRAITDLTLPENAGPKFYGFRPFQNIRANLTFSFETGTPYTRQDFQGNYIGKYNEERHPWLVNANLRFQKKFSDFTVPFSLFLDVRNVFNFTRPQYHYAITGNPDYPGVINPVYSLKTIGDDQQYLYNPIADLNNDSSIDPDESEAAYQNFLTDFVKLKSLYQKPREVWFGFQFHF